MRQRLWWRVPLLLLSLLLAGGALRADTVSGLDFVSSDWSASDPLASTIAAPGVPAVPGASHTGQVHVEASRGPAPGAIAADGVPPGQLPEHVLPASYLLPSGVAGRSVGVAHPHRGRAPPGFSVTGLS